MAAFPKIKMAARASKNHAAFFIAMILILHAGESFATDNFAFAIAHGAVNNQDIVGPALLLERGCGDLADDVHGVGLRVGHPFDGSEFHPTNRVFGASRDRAVRRVFLGGADNSARLNHFYAVLVLVHTQSVRGQIDNFHL